jgi:hypothetical protein
MATDSDLLRITRSVPQSAFRRVTVRFTEAWVDVPIQHDLGPSDPESIEYYVLRSNGPGAVFDDQSPTRLPWRNNCIYLRSSGQDLVVDLLLIAPAPGKVHRSTVIDHAMHQPPGIIYLGGSRTHPVQVP